MPFTDVQIASRALLKIGASPISSFSNSDAESQVAGNLYSLIRDSLLSSYPWRFASKQVVINKSEIATPIADFDSVFDLPDDFLRCLSAGQAGRGRGTHYRIQDGKLHANGESVTMTYIYGVSEENFPAHFTLALVARLAAEFCVPITEDSTRAEILYKEATNEIQRARQIDGQQDTPKRIRSDLVTGAR